MATNLKAKKKKGTYDNKLVLWISAGLAAFVVLVVSIFLIVSYATNYVAKVDGEKIYTYEYTHFLSKVLTDKWTENKPENFSEMSAEEQEKAVDEFWTDAVKKECQKEALEEARKFKAQYLLAVEAGFKLTAEEKSQIKSTIDSYMNFYMSQYGYSEQQAESLMTGGTMKLSEFKDYSILESAITKYKNHLKEGYTVTTEEMKELYDKDPDAYRTLTGRVFKFAIPTKPSMPKDDNGKDLDLNSTDEKYASKIDTYKKNLAKYEAGIEHYTQLCQQMEEAFAEGDKFTLYEYEYNETDKKYVIKKDAEGNESVIAKDATFEALCALSSWTSASSNKGSFTVGAGDATSSVEEIDEYILQMQWNEDRNGFIFVEKVEEEEESDKEESGEEGSAETSSAADTDTKTEEEKAKVTPSALKRIEIKNDDEELTELYLVRVENIDDFDTEVEQSEDSDEEVLNTVQSTIKSELLEERAVAELDKMVADAGDTYKVESIKQDRLDEILASMF